MIEVRWQDFQQRRLLFLGLRRELLGREVPRFWYQPVRPLAHIDRCCAGKAKRNNRALVSSLGHKFPSGT